MQALARTLKRTSHAHIQTHTQHTSCSGCSERKPDRRAHKPEVFPRRGCVQHSRVPNFMVFFRAVNILVLTLNTHAHTRIIWKLTILHS